MMAARENNGQSCFHKLNPKAFAGITLVSAIYFADICLKASRKCFWFDELFTTYLCSLPDFKSTWTAVLHGADFNPPLFYLLIRGSQRLFGDGLLATRMPAMVGVWLFGICLFLFVARRAGFVSGAIAGIFPFFTLAQYYAYEARAHGIVLGWCGLTLVCWQRGAEAPQKKFWLGAFGFCLISALLTHVYAVYILFPFGLVELYTLLRRRWPDWRIIAILVASFLFVAVTVYLPLFRMYRSIVPVTFYPASHDSLQRFLVDAIGPALSIFIVAIALCCFDEGPQTQRAVSSITNREVLLALGFACIPLVGLLGSKVSHGPFIVRYFLSSVAGYGILLGFASARLPGRWTARLLAGCMLLFMIGDLGTTTYLSMMDRIVLIEPNAGIALSTNPANPMQMYETLTRDQSGLDIIVLKQAKYLYFFRYASPAIVPRLYFGAPASDFFHGIFEGLAKGTHLNIKTTTFAPFLATHKRFLVYGSADGGDTATIEYLAKAGCKLRSVRPDTDGVMYEYER